MDTDLRRRYRTWYPARQQRFANVLGLMAQMAPAQYEAFRLCLWEGYSHDQAADLLATRPHLVQLARWRSEHFLDRHLGPWWKAGGVRGSALPAIGGQGRKAATSSSAASRLAS